MGGSFNDYISVGLSVIALFGAGFALIKQWVIRGVVDEDLKEKYQAIIDMMKEDRKNDKLIHDRVTKLETNFKNHKESYVVFSGDFRRSVSDLSKVVHELKGVVDTLAQVSSKEQ